MKNQYREFVKLTDVKEIMQDVCLPLLEAMRLRETDAIRASREINAMSKEMKQIRTDTR